MMEDWREVKEEDSLLSDEILADVEVGDTMVFSRGEAIALWVGVILFVAILSCVLYRLCRVTVQTLIQNMRPAGRQKKLNPQEKKVNKILSNQNAREILKSRAITAINSQASRSRRGYSSQLSLTSTGTVPDLTDRVIRVSFAPEGLGSAPDSPKTPSTPGTPSPPDYDTLSTHSRVSASDPPPGYAVVVPE